MTRLSRHLEVPASQLMRHRINRFYGGVLPARAGGVLADLGCGTRPMQSIYGPLVDRSVAIDWQASATAQVDALADLNLSVPLRCRAVDVVLLSDVLEHISEPAVLLGECRRILRSGGTIVGNVPFMYWLHAEPNDYFRYTEFGLRHLLESAGFEVVTIETLGGGFDVIVDVVAKIASRMPVVGGLVALLMQSIWIPLSQGPLRRERLNRKFPLAYGFVATAA